jgi:dGTP triphosphohydrolase
MSRKLEPGAAKVTTDLLSPMSQGRARTVESTAFRRLQEE